MRVKDSADPNKIEDLKGHIKGFMSYTRRLHKFHNRMNIGLVLMGIFLGFAAPIIGYQG